MRTHAGMFVAILLLASVPTARPGHAAGYAIYEQGAAVLGMAGAGTASVSDASALYFDPAALVRLPGNRAYAGGSLLAPVTSFAGMAPYPGYGVTEEMKRRYFFPPTLYVTHGEANGRWAVGAGVNSPYGLGIEWKDPDQFTGRYIVTRADLNTLNATASAAFAPSPRWSVAAGPDVLWAKVALRNRTLEPVPGGNGEAVDVAETRLSSDWKPAPGWHAALAFAPAPAWRLAASYRSKVVVEVDDGRAEFRQIPTGNPTFDAAVAASLPPDQDVSTVLRFPALWSAGAAWLPVPAWTVEADVNLYEWSVFRDLPIRFHQTPQVNTTFVENYDDAWQVRAGAEHRLPAFTYRFGYYFDQAAAPVESVTPLLPDAKRHGVSLGLGKSFGNWTVDVYELGLFVERRSTDGRERDGYDGEYKTFVNIAGLAVATRF